MNSMQPFLGTSWGDGPELIALRLYLSEILQKLPSSAKSQRTMICTWLCEILLHQIAKAPLNSNSNLTANSGMHVFD